MENNIIAIPEEALYANIDKRIKDRAIVYIMHSKLTGVKKTESIKGLIEEALDEYMINHPIVAENKSEA